MTRTEALKALLSPLKSDDVALFTTGLISRDASSVKDRDANFYMLGSMGLLSALGLGIALNRPDRRVLVVEGDGSALMSLGNFSLIGAQKPRNLYHVVIDNEAYESTGGQPTITNVIDLTEVARASSYSTVMRLEARRPHLASEEVTRFLQAKAPAFLLIKVEAARAEAAPRISLSPEQLKERLMKVLQC